MECAVFLAIFLPAADVGVGCFRFGEVVLAEEAVVDKEDTSFGFICMIFLARLGGGGSSSLFLVLPDNVRFRWMPGDVGGEQFMAAGGRMKEVSMSFAFSCAGGSVEVAGVGRNLARGIVSRQHKDRQT